MGLFRRNNQSAEELAQVRAQITDLRQQLRDADRAKAELLNKLDTVDQTNAVLYQRVDAIDQKNNAFQNRLVELDSATVHTVQAADSLAQRIARVDQQMVEVSDRFGVVSQHINARDAGVDSLGTKVDALAKRLSTTKPSVPPPPPPVAADARVTDLANQLEDLAAAVAGQPSPDGPTASDLEELRTQVGQVAERMAALDVRMTNVSVELANQLTELSDDLEVLIDPADDGSTGNRVAPSAADVEALQQLVAERVDQQLTEMRSSAEHLATEQARYQIQFREDLAELAERLRRPSAR